MIGITGVDQDPEGGLFAHYRPNIGMLNQVLACFNRAHHHRTHTSCGMSCSLSTGDLGESWASTTFLMQVRTRIMTSGASNNELIGDAVGGSPREGAQIMEQSSLMPLHPQVKQTVHVGERDHVHAACHIQR